MLDRVYCSINGVQFTEFDNYHPQQFDITKGGRNALTGFNRLRLVAKKWKLTLSASYISDSAFSALIASIPDTLSVAVIFRDEDDNTNISFTGYAVIDKSRTPESDAMGCWSDFSIEIIEN